MTTTVPDETDLDSSQPFTVQLIPYLRDPAPLWEDLRHARASVAYAEDLDLWLIAGYHRVKGTLADPETFSNALTLMPVYEMVPEALAIVAQIAAPPVTAAGDGPDHKRTRAALRAVFPNTQVRVAGKYGMIVDYRVEQWVDNIGEHEVVDLAARCSDLPLRVICDILGVSDRDVPLIKEWADGQINLVWNPLLPAAEQVRLAEGLLDFWKYCRNMTKRLHESNYGPSGLVTELLEYRDGRDNVLTLDEVASIAFNMLVAGHETTAALLTSAIDRALVMPDRWARVRGERGYATEHVEETLRIRPAIDGWLRMAAKPVEMGGVTIPAGARVLVMLGGAGRDPAMFECPGKFDTSRENNRDHLAFGYGVHYCVGAALARLEAVTALTRLAEAYPLMALTDVVSAEHHPNVAFRSHRTLLARTHAG